MLKLLLDEHISPSVAKGLKRRVPVLEVHAMPSWEGGRLLGEPDHVCLEAAAKRRLTLVTFDLRTIPRLLKTWGEEGRAHGGVIFSDQRTIPPWEIGGLIRALARVYRESGKADWTNRIEFLEKE
jgi:hypothetical protein